MKKVVIGLFVAVLASCQYHDLQMKQCYLASEQTFSTHQTYVYDDQNRLVSYSSPNISSSVLVYNESGKIVSEVDNQLFAITYTYDDQGRLTLWEENVQGYPSYNLQTKFFYNSGDQDTLQQFFHYNAVTKSFYLWRYARRDFASQKNYSKIRTYDAANTLLYTEDFQWDNHPNPYLSNAFFLNGPPPSNNMTHYALTIAGFLPQSVDYKYTYNANGFPLERKVVADNSTAAVYTYTNCQ